MADKINWNIPNIKASKISAANNAYTNPRFPIADQFSIWGKVAENVGKSVAMGMQQQQENVRREKAEQAALLKRVNNERVVQYDEVAKISSIGGSNFEESKDKMFYGMKDKYVEIKMAMDDPNSGVDPIVAARALTEINASISKYKTQAPFVLAAANELKTALGKGFGEAGAMASQTPTPQQEILMSLITDGNVGLQEYQGEFYLYKQDEEFDPGGLSVFNIDSYMKATSNGENPGAYFEQIIDTTEMDKGAVSAYIPEGTGLPLTYFTPQEEIIDGKKVVNFYNYRTDKNGKEVGKEALLKNMARDAFNFINEKEYLNDARNLYNDTAGFTGKQSGQDDVWAPNQTDKDGNLIRKEYSMKGYYKKDASGESTGEFVFDPKGNESQKMMDYATGKALKLTQEEFLKRWLSERALAGYGPKNLKTITSVSKVPQENTDSFSNPIRKQFEGIDWTADVPVLPPFLRGRGDENWFPSKKKDGKDLPVEQWAYRPRKDGEDDPTMEVKIFKINKKTGKRELNWTGIEKINGGKRIKNNQ